MEWFAAQCRSAGGGSPNDVVLLVDGPVANRAVLYGLSRWSSSGWVEPQSPARALVQRLLEGLPGGVVQDRGQLAGDLGPVGRRHGRLGGDAAAREHGRSGWPQSGVSGGRSAGSAAPAAGWRSPGWPLGCHRSAVSRTTSTPGPARSWFRGITERPSLTVTVPTIQPTGRGSKAGHQGRRRDRLGQQPLRLQIGAGQVADPGWRRDGVLVVDRQRPAGRPAPPAGPWRPGARPAAGSSAGSGSAGAGPAAAAGTRRARRGPGPGAFAAAGRAGPARGRRRTPR